MPFSGGYRVGVCPLVVGTEWYVPFSGGYVPFSGARRHVNVCIHSISGCYLGDR